ncbi:Ras GTPase activating protein ira2 [Puccinia graminis f. sp. tritici]|uniref:Ras GTPase activating protein ira2 n=1 Tax=Puccinia graminis f. sp. tritici TaxID=56615 RepID=A0A5B0PI60_PUCGR|nr:Ras GTPase activating protein ira2 [Puccinia graminis f. sp. tritici]
MQQLRLRAGSVSTTHISSIDNHYRQPITQATVRQRPITWSDLLMQQKWAKQQEHNLRCQLFLQVPTPTPTTAVPDLILTIKQKSRTPGPIPNFKDLFPSPHPSHLRQLLDSIDARAFNLLKKNCLVYYLLKEHGDGRENCFSARRSMSDPTVTPYFLPEIIRTLAAQPPLHYHAILSAYTAFTQSSINQICATSHDRLLRNLFEVCFSLNDHRQPLAEALQLMMRTLLSLALLSRRLHRLALRPDLSTHERYPHPSLQDLLLCLRIQLDHRPVQDQEPDRLLVGSRRIPRPIGDMNRHRLSSIIRELSTQFVHLKRAAQSDIALTLRQSIWNWIKTYPNEYASLVQSNGRLEGAPDVLFDVAHGLSENGKKPSYTWPMMSMLLAVCSDIVLKITVGDQNRSQVTAGKAAFIESLRKHLKAVKMTNVATACCVDLCKAATFSPKTTAEGPGLRLLALDLVSNLNSRLLDPSQPFTNLEGVVEIPLMSEALAALCKLDRHFVDTTLLEKCLSRNSFLPFQIAFIQACQKLASDPELTSTNSDGTADDDPNDMSNWNINLKELYPVIASSLRHVFMSAVIESNQFHILMRSNSKVMAGEDNTQKTELVWALLNLWTQDCKLAFFVPPGRTSAPQPGRSCHELNSRLASGAEINPDDLEMFVYLTTLLLNNRNPRPVRQAAMTVLRASHQPSNSRSTATPDSSRSQIGPSLNLPLGLKQTRAIVGNVILKSLLDSWVLSACYYGRDNLS